MFVQRGGLAEERKIRFQFKEAEEQKRAAVDSQLPVAGLLSKRKSHRPLPWFHNAVPFLT